MFAFCIIEFSMGSFKFWILIWLCLSAEGKEFDISMVNLILDGFNIKYNLMWRHFKRFVCNIFIGEIWMALEPALFYCLSFFIFKLLNVFCFCFFLWDLFGFCGFIRFVGKDDSFSSRSSVEIGGVVMFRRFTCCLYRL